MYLFSGSTGPVLAFHGLRGLAKAVCEILSGKYLSAGIIAV